MNAKELKEINQERIICQIGFVCKDIEKSVRLWVKYLHIGPWRFVTLSDKTVKDAEFMYKEGETKIITEPFKYICALCNLKNIQIELIQPLYGPTIYQKFLEEKGEGLHHIKEQIKPENWNTNLDDYEKRGMPIIQSGKYGKTSYAYVQSEKNLNFYLEFGDNIPNETYPKGSDLHYFPEK